MTITPRFSVARLVIQNFSRRVLAENNCGTGAGGFKAGNKCAVGGGGSSGGPQNMVAAKLASDGKTWTLSDGKPLPGHIPRIRPGLRNVVVSLDPKANLLVKGVDNKDRTQRTYANTATMQRAANKFSKVNELRKKKEAIAKEMVRDMESGDTKTAEAAAVLFLIHDTGIRPGSENDTKAAKQAYGATTLQARHVKNDGKLLQFVGKKGKDLSIIVTDSRIISILRDRAKSADDPKAKLFNVSDSQLRAYAKTKDGGGFTPKDWRTAKGTDLAVEAIKSMPAPTNEKAYKAAVHSVAVIVSERLGNTPAMALQAYIDPVVFSEWRLK